MIHNQPLLYEQGFAITIGRPREELYYFFDYDERQANVNMEFQHFHRFHEIFILLDERASHIIEGEYYDLQQYDMVLLKPSLLHKTKYPVGGPSKRLIINFAIPNGIPALSRTLHTVLSPFRETVPIFRFSEDIRDNLFSPLNDIFHEGRNRKADTNLFIHAKFLEFLCRLNDAKNRNRYEKSQFSDSISQKIYAITSYIHGNYDQTFSLENLSRRFFISPCYLSHQFKNVTGFSLVNYIQMTRIKNAQQLLLYTDMKIKDITERCGFSSFSQFNRVFNKFCHCPPSRYRASRSSETRPPETGGSD